MDSSKPQRKATLSTGARAASQRAALLMQRPRACESPAQRLAQPDGGGSCEVDGADFESTEMLMLTDGPHGKETP
ncbi:hypothetical protein TEQG_01682 [Trichophyton equinum CBS 127.97]|uniref:Uncharacterized protein n=1 Tax=Trichophyton equinum (strain ATCC MYA-4606 / CBS 127.97) TaxID=559882 RepID=F2PL49_TRIEC|nr:hypothetical protein TEQG_01682 [Trichophyton equinum CBS 127.97]